MVLSISTLETVKAFLCLRRRRTMRETEKEMLKIVKEHNDKGEEIYPEKLIPFLKGKMSRTTLYKVVRQLIDDGNLEERLAIGKRGACKHLFIPVQSEKSVREMMIEMNEGIGMLVTFFGLSQEFCDSIRRNGR